MNGDGKDKKTIEKNQNKKQLPSYRTDVVHHMELLNLEHVDKEAQEGAGGNSDWDADEPEDYNSKRADNG